MPFNSMVYFFWPECGGFERVCSRQTADLRSRRIPNPALQLALSQPKRDNILMTVEVDGFPEPEEDLLVAHAASHLAGRFCVEQGMKPSDVYPTGVQGADCATRLTLVTLRQMGIIAKSTVIDPAQFKLVADGIARASEVTP